MLEGSKVKEYFDEHPECVEALKALEFQTECWRPEFGFDRTKYIRPVTVDDVHYISFEGWFGEPGVFAWYYPCGVPHYARIAD